MSIALSQLTPAYAIHPGEMLKDELAERGINQKDFAGLTGIQQSQLNEIIKGKRGINAEHALLIGKALKMDASIWMNFQANYDLDVALQKEKNQQRMAAIDVWHALSEWVPVAYFKKQGFLQGDAVKDTIAIKEMYQANTLDEIVAQFSQGSFAYCRKSEKLSVEKVNLMGWMKLVAYKAAQQHVAEYNPQCEEVLIRELKKILALNKHTVEATQDLLSGFGIKMVVAPNPPKCAIDGIAMWTNNAPVIGLSLRHNRIDNFAFNVMHELGHVFLHLQTNRAKTFIDETNELYGYSQEETEANEFAKNNLINKSDWEVFMQGAITEARIRKFAKQQMVHPSTVVGRLSFETKKFNYRFKINKNLA